MKTQATVTIDRTNEVISGLVALTKQRIMVGVPADGSDKKGVNVGSTERPPDQNGRQEPNNAALAYIHNFGAPEVGIPAREFMASGIEKVKPELTSILKKATEQALDGNKAGVSASFDRAGLKAQAGIRSRIRDGIDPPIADATLQARIRSRKNGSKAASKELASRAAGNAPSTADAKPLIDTGQLVQSIGYVIRRNGST